MKKFNELKEIYRQTFINAPASQIANIAYDEIENLRQNYFQIKFMAECVGTNEKFLPYLEQRKFTYIELDKKIAELQKIKEPAVLLLK